MTPFEKSSKNTSGLNVDNVGVTLYGISSNRSGPRKTASNGWSARWPNSAVPRKPLNSVPGSGNGKRTGGAWCVCITMPPLIYIYSAYFIFVASLRNSISLEKSSIPQSVCGAVRRVFIWPAYCKVCTRNMAAPTNIFGGACIVGVTSWTVARRISSILASMTWTHLTRMTMRKLSTFIGSRNFLQNNRLGTRVNRTLLRSHFVN